MADYREDEPLACTCLVPGCNVEIATGDVMCLPHWRLVSPETQALVRRRYWAWQNGGKLHPYVFARNKAVAEVAPQKDFAFPSPPPSESTERQKSKDKAKLCCRAV
jgi:hypothetical protein